MDAAGDVVDRLCRFQKPLCLRLGGLSRLGELIEHPRTVHPVVLADGRPVAGLLEGRRGQVRHIPLRLDSLVGRVLLAGAQRPPGPLVLPEQRGEDVQLHHAGGGEARAVLVPDHAAGDPVEHRDAGVRAPGGCVPRQGRPHRRYRIRQRRLRRTGQQREGHHRRGGRHLPRPPLDEQVRAGQQPAHHRRGGRDPQPVPSVRHAWM